MANNKEEVQKTVATATTDGKTSSNTVEPESYPLKKMGGVVIIPDLTVKRRPYEKKGEQFYEYFVEGQWYNKTLEIALSAGTFRGSDKSFKDRDVYEFLDDLFDMFDSLYFGVKVGTSFDGRQSAPQYFVVGISPNNVFSTVEVSIVRPASRSKLVTLVNEIAAKYNVALPDLV
ncbi:MAG: hypothetical protein HFJ21_03380 [Clostridia bacterium]|jgi:hypothetical protein|nr:hypothetical protein [Clostridia bacterium]MCI9459489.1 hypothetical protein [Clostridia bacterium]